jgi:hypothetical protein
MKRYRFKIFKHTRLNGNVYYTCTVKGFYRLEISWDILFKLCHNLFNGVKYLSIDGKTTRLWWGDEWNGRVDLMECIDTFMLKREKEFGDTVVSVETEIIWR